MLKKITISILIIFSTAITLSITHPIESAKNVYQNSFSYYIGVEVLFLFFGFIISFIYLIISKYLLKKKYIGFPIIQTTLYSIISIFIVHAISEKLTDNTCVHKNENRELYEYCKNKNKNMILK